MKYCFEVKFSHQYALHGSATYPSTWVMSIVMRLFFFKSLSVLTISSLHIWVSQNVPRINILKTSVCSDQSLPCLLFPYRKEKRKIKEINKKKSLPNTLLRLHISLFVLFKIFTQVLPQRLLSEWCVFSLEIPPYATAFWWSRMFSLCQNVFLARRACSLQ